MPTRTSTVRSTREERRSRAAAALVGLLLIGAAVVEPLWTAGPTSDTATADRTTSDTAAGTATNDVATNDLAANDLAAIGVDSSGATPDRAALDATAADPAADQRPAGQDPVGPEAAAASAAPATQAQGTQAQGTQAQGTAEANGSAAGQVGAGTPSPEGAAGSGDASTAPTPPAGPGAPAPGVVTGTLTRVWLEAAVTPATDPANVPVADAATLQTWVETPTEAYPVVAAQLADVADGSTVTVDLGASPAAEAPHTVRSVRSVTPGLLAAGSVAFGAGSDDLFGVAAAALSHDVTVVLAAPAGSSPDGTSASAVASTVNGPVDGFWTQQSRGQRGMRVVATHGWQTLRSTCSDPFGLWDEVAGKVGWVPGTRRHLLVYVPPSAGCGAGLGTVGNSPDGGGRSWVSYNSTSIIAHELGHNLGLGHSDGLLCSGRADGTYASGAFQTGCTAYGYRDYYDVMGVSWENLGSLAAPHADALGLVRSTEKLVTAAPVRVRLVPASTDGLRVLRVDDPASAYYVEYRTASGADAWLTGNYRGLDAGVLVHRRDPRSSRQSLLLDGSVTSGTRTSDWRSALPAGASMTTASGVTRITVESQSSTGATIVVHRNGQGPPDVSPPADGAQVEIRTPTGVAAAAGTTLFSGVGTAPEGTLLWEVTQNGVRMSSGRAATGANGSFDTFQVPVALPSGTFTFRVWVPDESDGESTGDPALLTDETVIELR